jgi:hypothetical protein
MNDQRLRAVYAQALARRTPDSREGCPRPEDLQALADGLAPAAGRMALLDHVTTCAACHEEFALVHAATGGAPRTRVLAPWWGLAAAGLVVVTGAGWWLLGREGGPVMRGGGATIELVAPGAVAPTGRVAFTWRAVPGASGYEVTIAPPGAAPMATGSTQDTVFVPVPALPSGDYEWSVRAILSDGRVVPSLRRPLSITP